MASGVEHCSRVGLLSRATALPAHVAQQRNAEQVTAPSAAVPPPPRRPPARSVPTLNQVRATPRQQGRCSSSKDQRSRLIFCELVSISGRLRRMRPGSRRAGAGHVGGRGPSGQLDRLLPRPGFPGAASHAPCTFCTARRRAMSAITAAPVWSEDELAGLRAAYDLGSAPGDAVTKFNPTPGAQRPPKRRRPWGTRRDRRPPPTAAQTATTAAPLPQAPGAPATCRCRPTTTPSTATRRSMCPSCRPTAASCRVRAGEARVCSDACVGGLSRPLDRA